MEQWGSAIVSLQDNMNKLVEKVSTVFNNIENPKTHHEQNPMPTIPEEAKREENMRPSHNLNNSQTLGDYLEDFKKNITVYLDSVVNQNQTIIEENHKLRQNLGLILILFEYNNFKRYIDSKSENIKRYS